ncbi:MAG: hypothetical protein RIS90_1333 [Pseudomonadota bacterium]
MKGLRVLDLSRALSGPYCSMILGDLGADVTKVEAGPGGDLIRLWGPKRAGVTLYYLSANRNKRSLLLDFRNPRALKLIARLAAQADVVVENFRPGVMQDMGLAYETLRTANPRLIYASISGFGQTGPMRDFPGFDMIAQAMAGVMSVNGEAGGDPLRVGVPIGDMAAGMWLTIGILAALRQRDETGLGQRVDTSLFSTLLNMLSYHGQGFLSTGQQPQRSGNTHPVIQPYGAFQTSDGLMVIAPGTQDMWLGLCQTLGAPEMAADPRFVDPPCRLLHAQVLKQELEVLLSKDTAVRWSQRLVAAGIPAAPINTVGQALNDPQVAACGLIESVQHPLIGEVRLVAKPFQMSGTGTTQTVRLHPPQPGEHNQECLRAYGLGEYEIQALIEEGVVQKSPAQRSVE